MELYAHQRTHVDRIEAAFKDNKVVADVSITGAGKTIVAIKLAARLRNNVTVVIGPPTLRDQWLECAKKESTKIFFL